jgi:hypothetical protein
MRHLKFAIIFILIGCASSVFFLPKKRNDSYAWMDDRIQTDLAAFDEIKIKDLDALESSILEKNFPYVRIKMQRGKLSHTTPLLQPQYAIRVQGYLSYLAKLHKAAPLPDTDFVIFLEDGCEEKAFDSCNAPLFCISKFKSQTKIVAIPAMYLYPKIYKTFTRVSKRNEKVPWESKFEIGFWRGSTTGKNYTLANWMNSFRAKLVILSETAPNLLDCAFTGIIQINPEVEGAMRDRGLIKQSVSPQSQVIYKYLIAIDGNTCASSLKWQLFSDSVVLKNESDWVEWYDTALIPYKHYVPYRADFSDLLEKIEWLKQNDDAAKNIAEEARVFAQQNFTSAGVDLYVRKLLAAYSSRLR